MNFPPIKHISQCFIKPKIDSKNSNLPYYLTPWDIQFASSNYGQEGLIFKKPHHPYSILELLECFKQSLAQTLVHFYPVAGQLATRVDEQQKRCLIFVDCTKGPGVKFVHAKLNVTISDLLRPKHVPYVVNNLFVDNNSEINYDGHIIPLFMVQVTELIDGVFLGVSMNHMIADGIAHWHMLSCWSEVFQASYNGETVKLSRRPELQRWVPRGYKLEDLYVPDTSPNGFVTRYKPPPLKSRFFYFSASSVLKIKARASEENKYRIKISSFQALLGLVWRSIVRARCLPDSELTQYQILANNRTRLNPPLPHEYFGNATSVLLITSSVRDLTKKGLGYAAELVHRTVSSYNDKEIREFLHTWIKQPIIHRRSSTFLDVEPKTAVQVGGSPQSGHYGIEFGSLGRPIAVRKGNANTYDGKVFAHPGIEGGESVELGIWLSEDAMTGLESDQEFMEYVSSYPVNNSSSSQVNCRL